MRNSKIRLTLLLIVLGLAGNQGYSQNAMEDCESWIQKAFKKDRSQHCCKARLEGQIFSPGPHFSCNIGNYHLVWSDEFDGTTMNTEDWRIWDGVPGENEEQYYEPSMVTLNNGMLEIQTKKLTPFVKSTEVWQPPKAINGFQWTKVQKNETFEFKSGRIDTRFKLDNAYGIIKARIKIGKNISGLVPAFWLYGADPTWNELDMFEFFGDNSKISYNIHTNLNNGGSSHSDQCGKGFEFKTLNQADHADGFAGDFHIYGVEWTPYLVSFFVDDEVLWTRTRFNDFNGKYVNCPDAQGLYSINAVYPYQPMQLRLNTAVKPNLGTPPGDSKMIVDWVRVYYQSDCNNNGVVINAPADIPQKNDVLNFILAKKVTINANYSLPSGQWLKIIAQDKSEINGSFIVNPGAHFVEDIKDMYCTSLNAFIAPYTPKIDQDTAILNKTYFSLYPNPTESNFSISPAFKSSLYGITIFDSQGKLLFKKENCLGTFEYQPQLSINPKGVYLVQVMDYASNKIEIHKVTIK